MATPTASQPAAAPSEKMGTLKRILVLALIVIIAAGVAGGATWFVMSRHAPGPARIVPHAPPPPRPPVYFALEPITVNLQSDDGDTHYLRIGLTLKLDNQSTQDELTAHMPEIRSRILLALSNKHPEDLAPLEGKRELATELAALISQPTDPREKPTHVDGVLFTEFVVQ